jgi:hypothetical protein
MRVLADVTVAVIPTGNSTTVASHPGAVQKNRGRPGMILCQPRHSWLKRWRAAPRSARPPQASDLTVELQVRIWL